MKERIKVWILIMKLVPLCNIVTPPLQNSSLNQAQLVFHTQLRDSTLCHPEMYNLHPEWRNAARARKIVPQK